MTTRRRTSSTRAELVPAIDYDGLVGRISELLEQSRRGAARAVNRILTATYWQIGRYIVECEQGGKERAGYGEALIERLALDLTARYGRGLSERNLEQMRTFFLSREICQMASGVFEARAILPDSSGTPGSRMLQTPSGEFPNRYATLTSEIPQTLSAEFPSADLDAIRATKNGRKRQTLTAVFASANSDAKGSPSWEDRKMQSPPAISASGRVGDPDFAALLKWVDTSHFLDDEFTAEARPGPDGQRKRPQHWRLGSKPNLTQMHNDARFRVNNLI
jgi:DUF1016 N-terminal domain